MWWSPSLSDRPLAVAVPVDGVEAVLVDLGLVLGDGIWSDAGRTVGVARAPAGLFVGWLDVGWVAADEPFSEMRDIAHLVEHRDPALLAHDVEVALREAREVREDRLRSCDRCDERFVPGQMHGAATCYCCAERDGDVVH